MAAYFHGNSEIQGDGLQTLILMNPGYNVGYSDTQQPQPPANFAFLNSPAAGTGNNSLHAPPSHTQQFVGVPLPPTSSQYPHAPSVDTPALHGLIPRVQYHVYGSIDHTAAAREFTRSQQGLSLSLSSQQAAGRAAATTLSPTSRGSPSSASGIPNGGVGGGVQSVLLSSKYLKAAQELLDEVVNVGKGIRGESGKGVNGQRKAIRESSVATVGGEGVSGGGETSGKSGGELTTAERQEIQMKKAKLVHMLDEVEQRYRQYHHQMQVVISWFEQVAGLGSAKTYTALALQTISKQFRCLKDAILGQIKAASKSLCEEEGKNEGSRLKFVDHQLRQQKALQQLGMIQPNAWRPQRGLPERSVSVLRAWLFEHFLHPYPKDSDKQMLAKQTGLTRSQVSNWFINARVRLWKPMVEEMYVEEMKEHEKNGSEDKTSKGESNENLASKSNSLQEKSTATENQSKNIAIIHNNNMTSPFTVSTPSASPTGLRIRNQSVFTHIGVSDMEAVIQGSPKKQRSNEMLLSSNCAAPSSVDMDAKAADGEASNEQINSIKIGNDHLRQTRDGFSFLGGPTNFIGGFGAYPIGEIGRFSAEQFAGAYQGNGVSLTLGLPHCENLSMSGTHQSFLPNPSIQLGRRVELGEPNEFGAMNSPTSSHSPVVYETINLQNRKRFAAQLLHDFVA